MLFNNNKDNKKLDLLFNSTLIFKNNFFHIPFFEQRLNTIELEQNSVGRYHYNNPVRNF